MHSQMNKGKRPGRGKTKAALAFQNDLHKYCGIYMNKVRMQQTIFISSVNKSRLPRKTKPKRNSLQIIQFSHFNRHMHVCWPRHRHSICNCLQTHILSEFHLDRHIASHNHNWMRRRNLSFGRGGFSVVCFVYRMAYNQ